MRHPFVASRVDQFGLCLPQVASRQRFDQRDLQDFIHRLDHVDLAVSRTFFGMSARSFSLSFGGMMLVIPARCAASTFSFTPPISGTLPRNWFLGHRDVAAHRHEPGRTSAVASVMPA